MTTPTVAGETGLNKYEMVYILSPLLADADLEKAIENISLMITSRGGTVANIDRWGKRRLAYPLKNFTEGNYLIVYFNLAPALNRELGNALKINEEVFRHLIIKLD